MKRKMAEEERLQNQLTSGLKRKAEMEAEVTSGSPATKKLGLMSGTKISFPLPFSYHLLVQKNGTDGR